MASALEKPDFGRAATLLSQTQIRARERRRFRRAPLILNGRMLDPLGHEHDCRTADISPGDVRLASPILPEVGHRVVLYLDGFGRMAGSVARRCGEAEVAIIFEQSTHKREKLAEALTWAINKGPLGLEEIDRHVGVNEARLTRVEFENGESIEGQVLDFSLAGMTIRSAIKPPPLLGAWVRIGNSYGRIARYIDGGFAVDFETRRTQ